MKRKEKAAVLEVEKDVYDMGREESGVRSFDFSFFDSFEWCTPRGERGRKAIKKVDLLYLIQINLLYLI